MQFDYIIKLLNLQDKNIEITNVELKDGIYTIFINATTKPSCCNHCGSISITIKDYYLRTIKYQNILNYKCVLKFNQKRFYCKDCKKTFNENINFVSKNSTIANNLKIKIKLDSKKKTSFKDIAVESNISNATAYNEFKKSIFNYRCKLSRIVCIDEFKASTIAGEYALIIGNPLDGKILDVLPSRKQDYIYYYFQSISNEERYSVEYIVTDLFEPYKSLVEKLFWKSTHIADRFHWIKLATDAFNNTRIKIMNEWKKLGEDQFKGKYNKYTTLANVLKTYHKLFLINPHNRESWFFEQKTTVKYLKEEKTYNELIEWCCNMDSLLSEAYEYLMELYYIAKFSTFETAKDDLLKFIKKLEETKSKLPEFKKLAATYRHWLNPIVNSFIIDYETKARITNGFIEGKNNMVKVIKRIGFGFKDFDTFRYKILQIDDPDKPIK